MKQSRLLLTLIWLILVCCQVTQAQTISQADKKTILANEWQLQSGKIMSQDINEVKRHDSKLAETGIYPKEFNEMLSIKAQEAPLSVLIEPIAQLAHLNLILAPGVDDKPLNVDINNASALSALNNIMYLAGYGFRVNENNLVVLANETKMFRILLPPVTGGFMDVTSNESYMQSTDRAGVGPAMNNQQVRLGTKVVVTGNAEAISFWDDVQNNLKILLSANGRFSINKPAGMVIVTDGPFYLTRVAQYFKDLNARVNMQIEVDVRVVEVVLNNENRFGVDWHVLAEDLKVLNSFGLSTNFASSNFTSGPYFTFNADGSKSGSGTVENGVKLAIDALRKQGNVEIVSQPRVTILNNHVAVIQVGSTQSYVDRSSQETTQTGTITSVSTSQVQEGVTMRLLGNMVGDDIYLSVTPVITTIDAIRSIQTGNTVIEAPQITTKSINTMVKLKVGQTVAIGGLMTAHKNQQQQSVPLISKIPILGKLFQYSLKTNNKTELIIFITPKKG